MKASDMLRHNNGLKTTQIVLNKQQSGVDAAQKVAQTQAPVFTQQQLDAAGKKIDQMNAATPTDGAMKAARAKTIATQQAIANGVDVNQGVPSDEEDRPSVPIVKKEEPKPKAKQLSYADMYKILNPEQEETAEQKERREKKERTKARIAALGDGLRALSNIYFSTKGARVAHNPESDMTKVVNKRKEYMDAQREKNRAAWLTGYQRAMALDEQAKSRGMTYAEQVRHNKELESIAKTKNDQTLAEQMRYHDMMNENNKTKNDQGQQRIEQGNRRLDAQINHWATQDSLDRQRGRRIANKSGGGSRGGSSKEDTDGTLIELNKKHPKEVAEASETVAKAGIKPNTAAGRKQIVKIVRNKIAHNGGGSSHGGGSSSTGGKKKTGVHWIK